MKNVKNLFGMAVMATALVGCSSNDNLNPNANDNAGKAGEAYAKFTIQLPTVSGTRADDPKPGSPFFEGGTAEEYAVKDAQLLIFQKSGRSEGDYKFVETVNIGNLEPWTDNTPNTGVTRYANITAQLNGVSLDQTGNEYFALVILNNAGESKVTLPTKTPETTYSAWNVAAKAKGAAAFLDSSKGFYMANAPLYSTGEPTTLVPIKGVYSTKAEAQTNPATTVYVERGMAKVTVNGSDFKIDDASSIYNTDKVKINKWTLDVLNKSTFPVHVTTGLATDFNDIWTTPRFVATGSTPQRVYWGKDPNYNTSPLTPLTTVAECQKEFYIVDNNGKTYNGDPSSTFTWSANTTPLYCLENTFDINNMKQGQTTRVVLKATYTPHNLTSPTDKTFFMIGKNTQIWTKETLVAQITSKAKEMRNSTAVTVTINTDAPLLKGGSHLLSAADVTITDGTDITATFDYATLNTKLGLDNTETDANGNPKVGIKTYENGECYYIARIKHFNELTPWSSGEETYGTNNKKYLGRYGVLRNNWYDLTVSKVSAPGYPDVPVVNPTDSDDEDTKFINVEVKILDWAKRTQDVQL